MIRRRPEIGSVLVAVFALSAAYGSWRFVSLTSWATAFPSLLTALSLMGGAVLVRLARNAPITTPSAFNDEDLNRFFDSLEKLSLRLLWIFFQTMMAMFSVIGAIVILNTKDKPDFVIEYIEPIISGLMAFLLIWLVWRLSLMARGDIGFLRLQRKVIENALAREKRKQVEKVINKADLYQSPDEYGRSLETDIVQ